MSPGTTHEWEHSQAAASAEAADEAVKLIAQAERPLIVAGSGVFHADGGEALQAFARIVGAPIVTPIWNRGVINEPSGLFMGVIGGASGEPDLQPRADLMIIAGAAVDYRTRYLDRPPLRAARPPRAAHYRRWLAGLLPARVPVGNAPRPALRGGPRQR